MMKSLVSVPIAGIISLLFCLVTIGGQKNDVSAFTSSWSSSYSSSSSFSIPSSFVSSVSNKNEQRMKTMTMTMTTKTSTTKFRQIGRGKTGSLGMSTASVEKEGTKTTKKLSPPPPDTTMTKDRHDETMDMYGRCIQNTYGRYPLTIASGKGCHLYSTDGTDYLDFVSGIATCALGHAHPSLIDAVSDQLGRVHHVSNLYYIPPQARLASWICDNSPARKVFFCNSGAEANEAAIKLARKYCSDARPEITHPYIVTARQSFHGRTMATITATGQPKYHDGYHFGVDVDEDGRRRIMPGFAYVEYNDVDDLERVVQELTDETADETTGIRRGVAAVMMEPLQGEGGIRAGDRAFFRRARQLCDEIDALLMFDEVQVGMGRTGTLWGHEQFHVGLDDDEDDDDDDVIIVPDVFTSAKALGGGIPIGAMMACTERASETFRPGDHASTYGGNPLACAAGLAVAEVLSQDGFLDNVVERGAQLKDGLERIVRSHPDVLTGPVRGWGLLRGVEVRSDDGDDGGGSPSPPTAGDIVAAAMKEGLLLVPAGPTVVRFVPPLIVTEDDVRQALTKFERAVSSISDKDKEDKKME